MCKELFNYPPVSNWWPFLRSFSQLRSHALTNSHEMSFKTYRYFII